MRKILHVSYNNTSGAGFVPKQIHSEMKQRGYDSKFLVHGWRCRREPDVIFYYNPFQIFFHVVHLFVRRVFSLEGVPKYHFLNLNEERNYIPAHNILNKIKFQPDIIILYWTSRFINTKTISSLYESTKADIFWVMTDKGAYTGGCHYAWSCKGFQTDCVECPAISGKFMDSERANKNLSLKKKYLNDIPIKIIASSGDSVAFAQSSVLFRNKEITEHVLKVNTQTFADYPKKDARDRLKLKDNEIALFIGVKNLREERKGISYVIEALQILFNLLDEKSRNRIHVVYAAKRKQNYFLKKVKFKVSYLGHLDFEHGLPLAYRAADAFLSSSIMDTGPYMVNMSLAYGCPVISFDIGIAKELVVHLKTGFKSNAISAHSYCLAIKEFLDMNENEIGRIKENCNNLSSQKLQWKKTSLEHFNLLY